MRKALTFAVIVGVLLAGCDDGKGGPAGLAPSGVQRDWRPGAADANRLYLEQKHTVTIDVPEEEIDPAFQAVVAACNTDRKLQCTLLDSSLTKAENTTASITARLIPSGVESFIALAASHGTIESKSTNTNDLAKPIVDAEQRLKMLEGYMAELSRLQQQSRNDVDALIKTASAIAESQAKLESLKGEHAHLLQRVDFQIVNLYFFSNRTQSFATPIQRAFRDFGSDFADGIARAITGLAYLVPWLLILVPLAFLFRRLWRRSR